MSNKENEWIEKIEQKACMLYNIPEEEITIKIAEAAWNTIHDESALKYFNYDTDDDINTNIELCFSVMDEWYGLPFKYLPDKIKDKDLCLRAINKSKGILEFIPEEIRNNNYDICQKAVAGCASDIKYVTNKKFIENGLGILAVSRDGTLLRYIPEDLKSNIIVFNAIQQTVNAIVYIPNRLRHIPIGDIVSDRFLDN